MKNSYDVIVIGGGPAGCMAAGLVAESGLSTLLLERESVPRFHIGESLMPECYWPLQRLGMIDRMNASKFTRKKSVQFVGASGKESAPFYFTQHDPRESSTTWQVERAEFDRMLFERAGELGAECHDRTRVLDVLLDENQAARGVKVRTTEGQTLEIDARVIMDGSGLQALIANKLSLREDMPNLQKAAIWAYYKNAKRDDGDNAGATIVMHTLEKDSWFWFIPLSDDVTSIGCVGDSDYMVKTGLDSEARYNLELSRCPGLASRLEDAERVSKIHVAKEYSYSTRQHSGQGWVLIGDAFGFIDPLYSSGVYFALVMGERAADAVIEGFRKNDLSAQQLGNWCENFKSGSQLIKKLVEAFYTKEFSFGGFIRDNPQFGGNLTDLLIGRIFYDGAEKIFDQMDPAIEEAQQASPMQ
ncbi:NAD(P)/FAD-dependent oxidoreductase [Aureliella helgolandensis]|uniref:FAD-dependent oxidoreductase LodB n=1 Tax=Aureliella helgolandensis TaxID=2527968 RepID=A0A518FZI6_9BACT|nr:Putative FAD-dependent oxidoreductase LodB [Aureliella helgolandensis]